MNFTSEPLDAREAYLKKARSQLRHLRASSAQIQACALVSHDGLIVAAELGPNVDADRFGAMCASLLALASRATKEIDQGDLRQIILDGTQGPVLLTRAGAAGVLALAASVSPNLGKLILDTRNTAAQLAELRSSVAA